jgi:intracellular sulfur oxidation DsrE/DsrF family protein
MNLFRTLLLASLLSLGSLYADTVKVVYDLTTDDIDKIERNLLNTVVGLSKHYTREKKSLKVIVVISGNAYKYFVNDLKDSPYASDKDALDIQAYFKLRFKALHNVYGVRFTMCSSGMKARKIKKHTLYEYVHAEKMKSVYLIDAQNDGYAYMPIH